MDRDVQLTGEQSFSIEPSLQNNDEMEPPTPDRANLQNGLHADVEDEKPLSDDNETSDGAAGTKDSYVNQLNNTEYHISERASPLIPSATTSDLHHPTVLQQAMHQQMASQQMYQILSQQSLLFQNQQHQQKVQAHFLSQLNEQLQFNILQQSQLLQQPEKGKNGKQLHEQLQQLIAQQKSLVHQIHLQHRNYLVSQGLGVTSSFPLYPNASPTELQQLWKDATNNKADDPKTLMNGSMAALSSPPIYLPSGTPTDGFPFSGLMSTIKSDPMSSYHPLYAHNACRWPGCEIPCEDYAIFLQHLNTEHRLDDRSTAQARVQMQVVSQLELQLMKERDRLQAMMHHLHHSQQRSTADLQVAETFHNEPQTTNSGSLHRTSPSPVPRPSQPLCEPKHSPTSLSFSKLSNSSLNSGLAVPIRRRVSDKSNLPIYAEIQRNREFYKNTDIRPPFTYASLIRQGIIESPNKQLTLNEIYQWFQNTFAYFRRNEATWKNAVRHNLSLHKCFMRVENIKGAVWTVDEDEFYRRRPQKFTSSKSQGYCDSLTSQVFSNGISPKSHYDNEMAEDLSLKPHGDMSMIDDDHILADEDMMADIRQEVMNDLSGGLSESTHYSNDIPGSFVQSPGSCHSNLPPTTNIQQTHINGNFYSQTELPAFEDSSTTAGGTHERKLTESPAKLIDFSMAKIKSEKVNGVADRYTRIPTNFYLRESHSLVT